MVEIGVSDGFRRSQEARQKELWHKLKDWRLSRTNATPEELREVQAREDEILGQISQNVLDPRFFSFTEKSHVTKRFEIGE